LRSAAGTSDGLIVFSWRDRFFGKQLLGAAQVNAGLFQISSHGFPVMFGSFNLFFTCARFEFGELGGSLIVFGAQFGGV